MAIIANKFPGVYAAVMESVEAAGNAAAINNANVLTLGGMVFKVRQPLLDNNVALGSAQRCQRLTVSRTALQKAPGRPVVRVLRLRLCLLCLQAEDAAAAVEKWLGTKFKEGYPDFEVGGRGDQAQQTQVLSAVDSGTHACCARKTQCSLGRAGTVCRYAGVPGHVNAGDTDNGSRRNSGSSSGGSGSSSGLSTQSSTMNQLVSACNQVCPT
jgi:hypothetical protein